MRPGHGRPGKLVVSADHVLAFAGFNEAGAWSPRKAAPELARGAGQVLVASMRPGHGRPGKSKGCRRRRRLRRFNEAGAWSPRKAGGSGGTVSRSATCFNEAGAWSPRKAGARGLDEDAGTASMRPGHGRPGKVVTSIEKTPSQGLQ